MDMPTDPMMQGMPEKAPGKTVSITANADGTFTVEAEPQSTSPEAPEMGAENGMQDMAEDKSEGETGQTVQSVDEAVALAKQMLTTEDNGEQMSVEKAFNGGFNGEQSQGQF